jgi:hypothetical protein
MDEGLDKAMGFLILMLTVIVFLYLAILFLLGLWLVRYLWGYETSGEAGKPLPPTSMFGAPATVRWLAAYEYWLYQLEKASGIEFSTTPNRLLAGSLIISVGVAAIIGSGLSLFHPATAGQVVVTSLLLGSGVGLFTGWQLSKPAWGWFGTGIGHDQTRSDEGEGFLLGEEID